MGKIINVYVGEEHSTISKMPYDLTISTINLIKDFATIDNEVLNIKTNSPDVVSCFEYYSKTHYPQIKVNFYLYNEISTIDEIFREFNKAYDLLEDSTK